MDAHADFSLCGPHISYGRFVFGKARVLMYIAELLYPFTPGFLEWSLPSLKLDVSTDANKDVSLKLKENGKECRS